MFLGNGGKSAMLMWAQICWRRKDFRFPMRDDDSVNEPLRLGILRNPLAS